MNGRAEQAVALLRGVRVLDGGMASELEFRGAQLDGPLWSAHVLEDEPEQIVAVHRSYLETGAECLLTASYQVSRMGYAEIGLAADRADAALLRSVELARRAATECADRRVLVAASLGPYGAALHNGAEYHGNYGCSYADLVQFHRERIDTQAGARTPEHTPDLLAFETLPSLEEARAIGEALEAWPGLSAWFSFTCKDEMHVAHGELSARVRIGCSEVSPDNCDWRELHAACIVDASDCGIARGVGKTCCGVSKLRRGLGRAVAQLDGDKFR